MNRRDTESGVEILFLLLLWKEYPGYFLLHFVHRLTDRGSSTSSTSLKIITMISKIKSYPSVRLTSFLDCRLLENFGGGGFLLPTPFPSENPR